MKTRIVFIILLLLAGTFGTNLDAQTRAHEINEKLGRGLNLGNTFESPRENNWGFSMNERYIRIIAEQGFSHLRIPIRWNDYASENPPYTIEPWFLDTITKVVDATLDNGMYAMINMHHYDDFNDNPDSEHRTRFLAIWKQISEAFREYPDSLLFEFLNEPHQLMVSSKWNEIYQQTLDTVRIDNPTRICVVGPPDWNGVGSVDKLEWTADTNMILTVHYYNPFNFTHQGASWVGTQSQDWLGTTWDSTASERQTVINEFSKVRAYSELHNVPVHVGEFGAYSAADNASRARWTAYCARTFESFGFSWAYWEFQAGFGVFDPVEDIWRNYLLNALTEHIDPYSVPPDPWDIRNGDFHNGLAGWTLDVRGEAEASADTSDGEAVIEVPVVDGTDWHVLLTQAGMNLIQGGEYRLSLKAEADEPGKIIKAYFGKNSDPYNVYTNYETFNLTNSLGWYSFTFTMEEPSDNDARFSLILGTDPATFYLDSITLDQLSVPVLVEEITIEPASPRIEIKGGSVQLSAGILPGDANNQAITWEVVSGQNLAAVDQIGLLTATGVGDGNVRVRVSSMDGSGVSAEIIVTVTNQLQVESIDLIPSRTEIDNRMGSVWIYSEVAPSNASNKTLNWELISGSSIAEIYQSGILNALGTGDGNVVIRASSKDGSGVSSEVTISVINQVFIEQVQIQTAVTSITELKGSLQLTAYVLPANASKKEIAWSIAEGKDRAVVDQTGLVSATGNGNGLVTVRAAANDGSGIKDEVEITLSNQGTGIGSSSYDSFRTWIRDGLLYISTSPSEKPGKVVLFTIDGKKIIEKQISPFTSMEKLPVAHLEGGIYLLMLQKDGQIHTHKISYDKK